MNTKWPSQTDHPYETLMDFIDVVSDTPKFQTWLNTMEQLPTNLRHQQLNIMRSEMEKNEEPEEFIIIVKLLGDSRVFQAFSAVVRQI